MERIFCKDDGNMGEFCSTMICILALITLMMAFLDCMALVNCKTAVGQIARNYILRMETVGYLNKADEDLLKKELAECGVSEVSLLGTTRKQVNYGSEIKLHIQGKIKGEYHIEEIRLSTAKN